MENKKIERNIRFGEVLNTIMRVYFEHASILFFSIFVDDLFKKIQTDKKFSDVNVCDNSREIFYVSNGRIVRISLYLDYLTISAGSEELAKTAEEYIFKFAEEYDTTKALASFITKRFTNKLDQNSNTDVDELLGFYFRSESSKKIKQLLGKILIESINKKSYGEGYLGKFLKMYFQDRKKED